MKKISVLMVIALTVLSGVTLNLWRELEAGRQQIAILMSRTQERQTQERALIDALVAEQRIMNQAVRTSRGVTIRRAPEDRQRLLSAAIPYLSVQQLDEYQALLRT